MIAASVPGTAGGAAAHANAGAGDSARGGDAGPGFADLLSGTAPAATPAASGATTHAPSRGAAGERDAAEDTAADTPATLPDQLLALIGAWPVEPPPAIATAAGPATAGLPAGAPSAPAGAALPTALAAPAPLPAPGTVAATPTALPTLDAATTAAPATAMPPAPAIDPGANGNSGVAPPASPAGAGAIPVADLATALGIAPTDRRDPTAAGAGDTTVDIGDRGTLLAAAATTNTVATAARTGAAVAANASLALPADPGAGFDDAFGTRIGWLADQRIGHADIRLNPEHLGAIDVRLQIDGSKVSAEFHSAHVEVRHALENSVGRLREMLGQQGLQLTHADVGQGRGGEQGGRAATAGGGALPSDAPDASPADRPMPRPVLARGLLDEYA